METTDELLQRLEAEQAGMRAEIACLRGEASRGKQRAGMSRGHLLRTAGVLVAGAVGAVAAGTSLPALAANGDDLVAGQSTAATAPTSIAGSVLNDAALRVTNYYTGSFDDYSDALQAYTFGAGLAGLYGRNDAAGGAGVIGYSSGGYGASFGGGLAPLQLQPSASSGPPTSMNHQQGELYVDSAGVLWICTAGGTSSTTGTFQRAGSGAGVQLIQEIVLASDQATVTFTGIPQTYRDLRLTVTGQIDYYQWPRGDCGVRFNGDSGNNYSRAVSYNGTDSWNGTQYDASSAFALWLPSTSAAAAGVAGAYTLDMPAYASTTWKKTIRSFGAVPISDTSIDQMWVSALWNSTAAITEIDLINIDATHFKAGSIFSLYGIGGSQ